MRSKTATDREQRLRELQEYLTLLTQYRQATIAKILELQERRRTKGSSVHTIEEQGRVKQLTTEQLIQYYQQWSSYYTESIHYTLKQHKRAEQELARVKERQERLRTEVLPLAIVLMMAAMLGLLLYVQPEITGRVVLEEIAESYTDRIDQTFAESTAYTWTPTQYALDRNLTTVTLTGRAEGTGVARVYLEDKLVLEITLKGELEAERIAEGGIAEEGVRAENATEENRTGIVTAIPMPAEEPVNASENVTETNGTTEENATAPVNETAENATGEGLGSITGSVITEISAAEKTFAQECVETCSTDEVMQESYALRIELEGKVTLMLETIDYSTKEAIEVAVEEVTKQLDIKDSRGQKLDIALELIDMGGRSIYKQQGKDHSIKVPKGRYKASIVPAEHPVKEIIMQDTLIDDATERLMELDSIPVTEMEKIPITTWRQVYAINPLADFSNATVTVEAKGSSLYKCKEYDFLNRECTGSWKLLNFITPGEQYTFTLTPEDPAFGEGDAEAQVDRSNFTDCSACADTDTNVSATTNVNTRDQDTVNVDVDTEEIPSASNNAFIDFVWNNTLSIGNIRTVNLTFSYNRATNNAVGDTTATIQWFNPGTGAFEDRCTDIVTIGSFEDFSCDMTAVIDTQEEANNILARIQFSTAKSGPGGSEVKTHVDIAWLSIDYDEVDTTIPGVVNVHPTPDTAKENASNPFNITANVSDNIGIDKVWVNITMPNGVEKSFLNMIRVVGNSTTGNYTVQFNDTDIVGMYNVTFHANDTQSNLNNTIKTNFTILYDSALPNSSRYTDCEGCAAPRNVSADGTNLVRDNRSDLRLEIDTIEDNTDPSPANDGNITLNWYNDSNIGSLRDANLKFKYQRETQGAVADTVAHIFFYNASAQTWHEVCTDTVVTIASFETFVCNINSTLNITNAKNVTSRITFHTGRIGAGGGTADVYVDYARYELEFNLPAGGGDTSKPNISYPGPAPDQNFVMDTQINVTANVTDETALDTIYINVTWPNGSITRYTMLNDTVAFNSTPNNFTIVFNDTQQAGLYNISFYANDTTDNINDTIRTNFTIDTLVSLTIDDALVAFGSIAPGAKDDTIDDTPGPFTLNNTGNTVLNITINASQFFTALSVNNSGFRFNCSDDGEHTCKWGCATDSFRDMPRSDNETGANATVICDLEWRDNNDTGDIDIAVSVPTDEGGGSRTSTVTFTAAQI